MKFLYPHWIHLCIVPLAIAAVLICHLYIDPACGRVWYHTDRWRRMVREDSTGGASGITDGDGPESCTQTICDIAWLLPGIPLWTPLGSPSTHCDHLRRGLWDSGLLRFHPGVCSTRWVSYTNNIYISIYWISWNCRGSDIERDRFGCGWSLQQAGGETIGLGHWLHAFKVSCTVS